jgi:NADH:ubiquinone oxidoreductase subunit D
MNIGPQHPSTHGVLRLIAIMTGEIIKWINIEIGLLHRGTEKLMEYNHTYSSIGYLDRMDYVSIILQE